MTCAGERICNDGTRLKRMLQTPGRGSGPLHLYALALVDFENGLGRLLRKVARHQEVRAGPH